MAEFSHIDKNGEINMVDINHKKKQTRIARASGQISMATSTLDAIREMSIKKGDVMTIAQIAGIQAAKQTANLIPLCHQLDLEKITVDISLEKKLVKVQAIIKTYAKTGVEIEALTAVQVALLTIYDMCKAIDKNMIIGDIKLLSKEKI